MKVKPDKLFYLFLTLFVTASTISRAQVAKHCTLTSDRINSSILRDNKIGIDPVRGVKVLLPPDYADSGKRYPVVYYCHNIFWSGDRMFDDGRVVNLVERGFASGIVKEFIFVVADYTTPTTGSVYENSPTSGRWLDFTVSELVPFIDNKYRTIRHRDSRAISGDFMGGRGALKLAMTNADLFGTVYALHPVATGTGDIPWPNISIDWKKILQATSMTEITDTRSKLFITFCQGYLPNPDRPPFYCDFFMELENGEPKLNVENSKKVRAGFLLDATLESSVADLQSLRGIGLDWGRFDETRAHVTSNRDFSRMLQDLGIEHEAEEYAGSPYNKTWTDDGRFYTRLLPFIDRHLVFEEKR
ncbi:MAG TPA: alpha/beta hydrolase-fold protein [Chryseolinea sp.]|nr:alpha/beta hydrolase-fold protein [Chryseolinea sp.]